MRNSKPAWLYSFLSLEICSAMWKQWQSGRELGLFARSARKGWRDKGVKVVFKNNFRVIGAVQTGKQVLKFPVLKEELSQGSKVRREECSKPSFGQLQHLMSGWERQWRLSDYRGGYQVLGLGGQGKCPKKVEVYLSPAAGEISNRMSGKSTVFSYIQVIGGI